MEDFKVVKLAPILLLRIHSPKIARAELARLPGRLWRICTTASAKFRAEQPTADAAAAGTARRTTGTPAHVRPVGPPATNDGTTTEQRVRAASTAAAEWARLHGEVRHFRLFGLIFAIENRKTVPFYCLFNHHNNICD